MRTKPKQTLVVKKVKYARVDNSSRQRMQRVLELLLRHPPEVKKNKEGSNTDHG